MVAHGIAPVSDRAAPLPHPLRAHAGTAGAVALFLLIGFVLFGSTGHDDSHITYWAALALRRYGQIVNYNGERVEQSSSLAHVVLLALLNAATRVSIPTLGPVTSIAGGAAAVVLAGRLGGLLAPGKPAARWGAELLTATAGSFVYWAFGGLETTIFAAASLWLVLACARVLDDAGASAPGRRGVGVAAAAMALFVCLRPEAPLVLGCVLAVALGHALRRGAAAVRAALVLVAVGGGEAVLLFAFRRAYFGAFFPNPVYSKATTLAPAGGLRYQEANLCPAAVALLIAAAVGLFFVVKDAATDRTSRAPAALAAAFALAYAGINALTGGDWMAGGRFVAHVLPMLCVLAAAGVARAVANAWARRAALALLVYGNLYGIWGLANGVSLGRPIWTTGALRTGVEARTGPRGYSWFELVNEVHLRDTTIAAALVDVVGALRRARPDRPLLVMSGQAGMVAYHAFAEHYGALRFIDVCSLATREFRSCVPAAQLDRRTVGLVLPLERYFRNEPAIDAKCGTRRPDLVFGLSHRGEAAMLERSGYTLFVQQRGRIESGVAGRPWLRTSLPADEFIAVDSALLAEAGLAARPAWTWDIR